MISTLGRFAEAVAASTYRLARSPPSCGGRLIDGVPGKGTMRFGSDSGEARFVWTIDEAAAYEPSAESKIVLHLAGEAPPRLLVPLIR